MNLFHCPPRRLLAAVLGICTLQLAAASQLPSHHVYQPGKLADSCAAADFDASYWTADSAPSTEPGVALVGTTYGGMQSVAAPYFLPWNAIGVVNLPPGAGTPSGSSTSTSTRPTAQGSGS